MSTTSIAIGISMIATKTGFASWFIATIAASVATSPFGAAVLWRQLSKKLAKE
jgi:hypothetical protein